MKRRVENNGRHAFIVPWALFLGCLTAFAACCMAGRRCSETHVLTRVHRFHQLLTPESLFYPTASQVKQLAMARTRKSRINVIIGGSSVLNGCGQQAHELWSDKLAEILGPEYRVVNLGFRAALPGEFGALGAEMIMNRRRVILLTDVPPGGGDSTAVDGRMHRYFYWDAWYKRLIDRKLPLRQAGVAALLNERKSDPTFFELRAGARLDSACFYNDLWNAWTYTQGGTIWNTLCRSDSFKARMLVPDNEPKPPTKEVRHAAADRVHDVQRLSNHVAPPRMEKDSHGQWLVPSHRALSIQKNIDASFPNAELRRRTIAIVTSYEPSGLAGMTHEQREQFAAVSNFVEERLMAAGMRCARMDGQFTDDDFADYVHLSASGGEKLAQKVAPIIRELAATLGYKEQSETDGRSGGSSPVRH
jgi:hypothetical protein